MLSILRNIVPYKCIISKRLFFISVANIYYYSIEYSVAIGISLYNVDMIPGIVCDYLLLIIMWDS